MLQGLESLHDEIKMILVRNQITSISITDEEIILNNGNNNEQDGSNNQNSETSIMNTNQSTRQVAREASIQIVNQTSQVEHTFETLKNPDVVACKGRPRKNIPKSKRWIPTSELVRTKQKITCSRCGSNQLNMATCTADVDDAALLAKKAAVSKKAGTELQSA